MALTDDAITRLRTMIQSGELPPGCATADVRDLYLTAVVAGVLGLPWDEARHVARGGRRLTDVEASALVPELGNLADSGARWCSITALSRHLNDYPDTIVPALRSALQTEPSRELIRSFGLALAGPATPAH